MAAFVLIIHEYDHLTRSRLFLPSVWNYLICDVLVELRRRGHKVKVAAGTNHEPEGDMALLHVDCTVVPKEYFDFASRFPAAININVADITKRRVSQALIGRESDWSGPVIVKSNYNALANMERAHNRRARRLGRAPPHRNLDQVRKHKVYPSSELVPEHRWGDDDVVIEKFIPETDPHGYGIRIWHFLGAGERCTRYVSPDPIIKTDSRMTYEAVPVPDDLRETRRRLGFDYGKWEFVMHQGRAVLIDANKTPGRPPNKGRRRDLLVRAYVDDLESRV